MVHIHQIFIQQVTGWIPLDFSPVNFYSYDCSSNVLGLYTEWRYCILYKVSKKPTFQKDSIIHENAKHLNSTSKQSWMPNPRPPFHRLSGGPIWENHKLHDMTEDLVPKFLNWGVALFWGGIKSAILLYHNPFTGLVWLAYFLEYNDPSSSTSLTSGFGGTYSSSSSKTGNKQYF